MATPGALTANALAAARAAGWRRVDLVWERLEEEANAALVRGDPSRAVQLFRRAGWVAFWRFPGADPRQATTLANLGFADRLSGRETRAQKRYAKARRIWNDVDRFIAELRIVPRARSSLFHLRMEMRHRETYQQNMRIRLTAFTRETAAALEALERGEAVNCRLYERWRAEKPPIFDDTRKLLAAALLVATPASTGVSAQVPDRDRNGHSP